MPNDKLKSKFAQRQFVANMGDRFVFMDAKPKQTDMDKFAGAVPRLAETMVRAELKKSNVRGLESIAWSTDSATDLLDYIRIRVGRNTVRAGNNVIRKEWARNNIGIDLAQLLEDLRDQAIKHLGNSAGANAIRELHLELCREFIKHLVGYFEFEISGVKNG
ncbi:hypothetical protein KC734_10985 [candidate division KSB1 bacterium]|nr:hypothetical protein [candidate division KSB1 bacterium]